MEETRAAREQTEADVRESTTQEKMEVTNEKTLKETLKETGGKIRGHVNINTGARQYKFRNMLSPNKYN